MIRVQGRSSSNATKKNRARLAQMVLTEAKRQAVNRRNRAAIKKQEKKNNEHRN